MNRLLGREKQRTRDVRAADQRGRHTTSQRELIALPGGALLVDTPGLREVQLWAEGTGLERRVRGRERVRRDLPLQRLLARRRARLRRACRRRGGPPRPGAPRQLSSVSRPSCGRSRSARIRCGDARNAPAGNRSTSPCARTPRRQLTPVVRRWPRQPRGVFGAGRPSRTWTQVPAVASWCGNAWTWLIEGVPVSQSHRPRSGRPPEHGSRCRP